MIDHRILNKIGYMRFSSQVKYLRDQVHPVIVIYFNGTCHNHNTR